MGLDAFCRTFAVNCGENCNEFAGFIEHELNISAFQHLNFSAFQLFSFSIIPPSQTRPGE